MVPRGATAGADGTGDSAPPSWVFASVLPMDAELVEDDDDDQHGHRHFNPKWDSEVDDVSLDVENLQIQVVGRGPRAKAKTKGFSSGASSAGGFSSAGGGGGKKLGRDELKKRLLTKARQMIFAPNADLLVENETLVSELPYASIETMFNLENVYGNRQNHHPACILFNVDEPLHWETLLPAPDSTTAGSSPAQSPDNSGKGKAATKAGPTTDIPFIDLDVVVPASLKLPVVDAMTEDIIDEMKENMRLIRAKKGMDCQFEERYDQLNALDEFLDRAEERMHLDPFLCPEELRTRAGIRYNWEFGPPDFEDKEETKKWKLWIGRKEKFDALLEDDFPVRKGKKFRAFPVHFSTPDIEEIRGYLSESIEYRGLLDWSSDAIVYTVHCKMYPLIGGILSVWFVLGAQTPQGIPFFDDAAVRSGGEEV